MAENTQDPRERLLREIFGEKSSQTPNSTKPQDPEKWQKLKKALGSVLTSLSEREQEVLELRFGLTDGYARTMEEVGKQFKVTAERIRQIEAKGLRKMRHPTRIKHIQGFLETEDPQT